VGWGVVVGGGGCGGGVGVWGGGVWGLGGGGGGGDSQLEKLTLALLWLMTPLGQREGKPTF